MKRHTLYATFSFLFMTATALASDFHMKLIDQGMREYYCQITVELENKSDKTLTEVSGYFYNYIGQERVGRSKGTWFMNVAPGEISSAKFETPNAPCTDEVRYEFVVGACRLGPTFEDVAVCTDLLRFTDPLGQPNS
ncbi:MAG: hypothetical protein AAF665_16985 [Pseudomonadota bacterium]